MEFLRFNVGSSYDGMQVRSPKNIKVMENNGFEKSVLKKSVKCEMESKV